MTSNAPRTRPRPAPCAGPATRPAGVHAIALTVGHAVALAAVSAGALAVVSAVVLAVVSAVVLWRPEMAAAATRAPGWVLPLPGALAVERPFDRPTSAYGPGHRGVDLRGHVGEAVRAAGEGRVAFAGLLAGRGVLSVVHPDGRRTTYEPVTASVTAGEEVRAGQLIGLLQRGHCPHVPACLHWGLLRGTTYLDPMSLLGPVAVRLLPLGSDPWPTTRVPALRRRPVTPPGPPVPSQPSPHLLPAADPAPGSSPMLMLVPVMAVTLTIALFTSRSMPRHRARATREGRQQPRCSGRPR